MLFTDLEWVPHPARPDLGQRSEAVFANGWTVTLLRGDFSIHMERARKVGKPEVFEIAIWEPEQPILQDAITIRTVPLLCGDFSIHMPLLGDAAEMQRIMDLVEKQEGVPNAST